MRGEPDRRATAGLNARDATGNDDTTIDDSVTVTDFDQSSVAKGVEGK